MADTQETVHVEVLIRLEGAAALNRIALIELPIEFRGVDDQNDPVVKFNSRVLVALIIKALKKRV